MYNLHRVPRKTSCSTALRRSPVRLCRWSGLLGMATLGGCASRARMRVVRARACVVRARRSVAMVQHVEPGGSDRSPAMDDPTIGTRLASRPGVMIRVTRSRVIRAGAVAGALVLGGCGGTRAALPIASDRSEGRSWELVLPSETVTRLTPPTAEASRAEWGRRDGSLAVRSGRAATALDRWPITAPTLDRPHRVYLPSQTRDLLYFRFVTTRP